MIFGIITLINRGDHPTSLQTRKRIYQELHHFIATGPTRKFQRKLYVVGARRFGRHFVTSFRHVQVC